MVNFLFFTTVNERGCIRNVGHCMFCGVSLAATLLCATDNYQSLTSSGKAEMVILNKNCI